MTSSLAVVPRHRALVLQSPLLDDVLEVHRAVIGRDFPGYRGHVYRTFNFALALAGSAATEPALAVAAAFHDVGIWTDRTFDYLAPSARRAADYVKRRGLNVEPAEVERLVSWHHRVRPCSDLAVEAFRRADWLDVSWGLLRFGLPRELLEEARQAFPNAGFHRCLLREGLRWAARHPFRPLPMFRF